jgi:hypothetical protein
MGRRFLEAVIKAKLANILSNQDESDVACSARRYLAHQDAAKQLRPAKNA